MEVSLYIYLPPSKCISNSCQSVDALNIAVYNKVCQLLETGQ